MKLNSLLACALAAATYLTCTPSLADDAAAEIRQILTDGCKATENRDVAAMIAPFAAKTDVIFDFDKPRSKTYEQLRHGYEEFVGSITGQPSCRYLEIHPTVLSKDAAYSWAIMQASGEMKGGGKFSFIIRSTDVWRKVDGKWKIVHEHNSFPVDMATGMADTQSTPSGPG